MNIMNSYPQEGRGLREHLTVSMYSPIYEHVHSSGSMSSRSSKQTENFLLYFVCFTLRLPNISLQNATCRILKEKKGKIISV
jgi:hypothetical protein